jgi:hypothetical protein
MDEIYARMNDALTMAHAARRAEASYGKLAQLKTDIFAAEQAQQWISHLCWWLHRMCNQEWDFARMNAVGLERIRTA